MSTRTSRRTALLATAAVAAALVGGSVSLAASAQAAPLTTSSSVGQRVGDDNAHADDNGGLRHHGRGADDAAGHVRHGGHAEPGDDKGVHAASTTVFTTAASTGVAAADDHGRRGGHAEPGDDRGGRHGGRGNDDAPGHH
ncbi:hypothetical protein B7R54_01370 [Subtercola boreus]|uniref:Uncharacterized protein n=1 Tax=Subtercola boreus TaxID=120213 RepID=A0A3E0VDM3_9MICO|nr:hypothetical protein [Subtercola boreus]RFA08016.1 hypothetical protein B7R54_01370 [Subtercola boreus]TQL55115.1 hypothetical protein FB464_2672 [Subtercola boreus]